MPEEIKTEQSKVNEVNHGQRLAEWSFPEYNQYPQNRIWYVVIGIIALALIIYSVITQNFLFTIIVILFGGIIVLHLRQPAGQIKFQIFEGGVQIGNKFYEWNDIKNFRLVYEPPAIKRLYIDFKNVLLADFSIPLGDQNPLEIREVLKKYLEEDLDRHYETLADKINRWLKL